MTIQRLTLDDIMDNIRSVVEQQSYAPKQSIEGVKVLDLRLMADDGGSFLEMLRCDENGEIIGVPGFRIAQSNFSEVLPGAVKAWHLHFNQEDLWFIPPSSRLLVGLYDLRKEAPSCGVTMRFTMGGGKSQLLYIPRGVAHGVGNPWEKSSYMFYFVNQQFRVQDTDENRLPWNFLGDQFWSIHKG